MPQHYLYRHVRPDTNVPFYIGIGTKQVNHFNGIKSEYKRAFVKEHKTPYWKNIFNKCNQNIEVEILYESDSFDEIKEKEKEFITLYGRHDLGKGPLVNLTDGGDGVLGNVRSEESKKLISKILTGKKRSPETCKRISLSKKGIKKTPEQLEKHRIAMTGRTHSEETKKKMSLIKTGIKYSDETRKKISDHHTGRKLSEEHKKKVSISLIGNKRNFGKKVSEESRLRMSLVKTGKVHSEETKRKISEANKKVIKKPMSEETKKKISLSLMGNNYRWGNKKIIHGK